MYAKYITPEGKEQMLKLAFMSGGNHAFQYLALGGENSEGARAGQFSEISGDNYQRVSLESEGTQNQSITLSGIFEDSNFNPSNGRLIKEIGIVDSSTNKSEQTFFAYAEVPEIYKNSNISLKYTIIITLL